MLILIMMLSPLTAAAGEAATPEEPKEQKVAEHQVAAEVSAPHALLMEVSTGTILMGKGGGRETASRQCDEDYDNATDSGGHRGR